MTEEDPRKDEEVTRKGAVEVDEQQLDQAAGGGIVIEDRPAESVSLNFKTATTQQKVAPAAVPPPDDGRI